MDRKGYILTNRMFRHYEAMNMILNLKRALKMYHPSLIGMRQRQNACILREQDPDFNSGKGDRFFRAFDRAILRGDFNDSHSV